MKLALVGGFLGSGKTTAIIGASMKLIDGRKKVAVITNDQGDQQVDTALVNALNIPGAEVSLGCFCCKYDELLLRLEKVIANSQPDLIFAESVGSCTDLIATVVQPLRISHPGIEITVSIFADAEMLASLIEGRSSFIQESVRYIYKKQIEEADVLVVNKVDTLSANQLSVVDRVLKEEYPDKVLIYQNSLDPSGIDHWLKFIDQMAGEKDRRSLVIDYDIYADGESQLAWLDKSVGIFSPKGEGVRVTREIVRRIFDAIRQNHLPIGHLKFFIETDTWSEKVSFTTTTQSATIVQLPELDSTSVKLLINARIETSPALLEHLIGSVLTQIENDFPCSVATNKTAVFKPGYPTPTHRITG